MLMYLHKTRCVFRNDLIPISTIEFEKFLKPTTTPINTIEKLHYTIFFTLDFDLRTQNTNTYMHQKQWKN